MLSVIIPYRDRETHLKLFVPYINTYLDMFNIEHEIVIIEQADNQLFNRGKLLNVGYTIASKAEGVNKYFAFHDIDMLPITADYSRPNSPTHLVTDATQFPNGIPYDYYFGGVTLFTAEDFQTINGYSNNYWGWGSEDDDLLARCKAKQLQVIRREIGIFKSLEHISNIDEQAATENYNKLVSGSDLINDGLTTLEYELISAKSINARSTMYSVLI